VPNSEELTAGWRKWYDQQLCNLYSSPNVIYWYDEIKDSHIGWTVSMQAGNDKCVQDFGSKN
jgi:hypothetical protein